MIVLKNITKTYKSKQGLECKAVDDISLSLPEKGLVFLCGKSGSGKTTLLNIMSGMDSADSGDFIIAGKSSKNFMQSDFDTYRNTYVGYIFQDFGIIEELNVRENISLSLELQNLKPTQEQVDAALEQVGLAGYGERKSSELSGGQRQRISIARALIKNPKIVFGDEPTGSLDAATGKQIFGIFKELSKTRLVVIISHDFDAAVTYGDRVVELRDGKIASDKTRVAELNMEKAKAEYQSKIDKAFSGQTETICESEQDAFINVKTKMPFKSALKISLSNFKESKVKSVFTVLLSIIALTTFCLADTMRKYDFYQSTLATLAQSGINTVMLSKYQMSEPEDPDEEPVKTYCELSQFDIDRISNLNDQVFKAYKKTLSIGRYTSTGSSIFNNEIRTIVETSDVFNAETLKGFYNSTLKEGNYPKANSRAIEILISDYLADSIMFYGARFDNDYNVIPNTGYDKILRKPLTLNGIPFLITGIFETDYKKVYYETDVRRIRQFNLGNIYCSVLTTKDAMFNYAIQSQIISFQSFLGITGTEQDNLDNFTLNFVAAEDADERINILDIMMSGRRTSVSRLKDGELIISFSLLKEILGKNDSSEQDTWTFQELTVRDFEQLSLQLAILSPSRAAFNSLLVAGVFDDSDKYLTDTTMLLQYCMMTTQNTKEAITHNSLIITNAYLALTLNETADTSMLEYLEGQSIDFLNYATMELESLRMLFSLIATILVGASFLVFMLVMLLIFNFISSSILNKTKEIGVLRAMGARGKDTAKIFAFEGMIIFALTAIISVILTIFGSRILNTELTRFFGLKLSVISFNIFTTIYGCLAFAVMIFIASAIPLRRIIKMKPIDVIKS